MHSSHWYGRGTRDSYGSGQVVTTRLAVTKGNTMAHPLGRLIRTVLATALTLALLPMGAAFAQETAVLSGRVHAVGQTTGGFADVNVTAIETSTLDVSSVSSQPDGTYSFTTLPAGNYWITADRGDFHLPFRFAPGVATQAAATSYAFDGTTSVTANISYTGVGGTVGATRPLEGGSVRAVNADGSTIADSPLSGDPDTGGPYAFFVAVDPGSYVLRYDVYGDDYLGSGQMFSGNTYTRDTATPVAVTGTTATTASTTFGTITGKILGPDGAVMTNSYAWAYTPPASEDDWWDSVGDSSIDETGTYQIFVAPGREHAIEFSANDYTNGAWSRYYYGGSASEEDGQRVTADAITPKTGIDGQFRTVSGTVSNNTGNPVQGATVEVIRGAGVYDEVGSAVTSATGAYTALSPAMPVEIKAERHTTLSNYLTWYGGERAAANKVDLTSANATGKNLTFHVIRGKVVTRDTSDVDMRGAYVYASDVADEYGDDSSSWAKTDAAGVYEIGVPTGNHVVRFDDASDTSTWYQYYDQTRNRAEATPVAVTDTASASNINGVKHIFSGMSSISGRINVPSDMTLTGDVSAENIDTGADFDVDLAADGTYSMAVPSGEYDVFVEVYSSDYDSSGYAGVSRLATTAAPAVVNLTFAKVGGTVIGPDTSDWMSARIRQGQGYSGGWGEVQDNGTYTALAPVGDAYYAQFYVETWDDETNRYGDAYGYSGNAPRPSSATRFAVPAAGTTGINHRFNLISGSLTDTNGNGVRSGSVTSFNADAGATTDEDFYLYNDNRGWASVAIDGSYQLPASPGQYKVRFSHGQFETGPAPESWYNNAASYDTANVVTVPSSANLAAINGKFEGDLGKPVGTISGTVVAPGTALNGWVNAYDAATEESFWGRIRNGAYSVMVTEGTYEVELEVENADDSSGGWVTKQNVAVTPTSDPVINQAFTTASGTLTLPADVTGSATVSRSDELGGGYGDAAANGAYTALVPAADGAPYSAHFFAMYETDDDYGYSTGYFGNAQRQSAAPTFTIPATGKTGIDHRFSMLRGSVTDSNGNALPWSSVRLANGDAAATDPFLETATERSRGYGSVAQNGSYAIPVSASSLYKVKFTSWLMDSETAEVQWYNNQTSFAAANVVTMPATGDLFAIDARFTRGSISGKVTQVGTTTGLANVCVTAWNNGEKLASATTRSDGTYTLYAAAGTYKLKFIHCIASPTFKDRWFSAATDEAGAEAVTITDKTAVTGKDVALETGFVAMPPVATTSTAGTSATTTVDPRTGESKTTMPNGEKTSVTFAFAPSCAAGTGAFSGPVTLGHGTKTYPMTDAAGTYSATIPSTDVTSAPVTVSYKCGDTTVTRTLGAIQLYDPSGDVTNASTGAAVAGATVTLYRVPGWEPKTAADDMRANTCQSHLSKAEGTKWNQAVTAENLQIAELADPNSGMIDPAVNPQLTNGNGRYGWNVAKGCWFVTVAKDGYKPYTSALVGVPPEVTDLDVALIPNVTPPPPVKATAITSAVRPARVVFGGTATVTGKLTDKASGAALASRNVVIQRRTMTPRKTWSAWSNLATVTTTATGTYTKAFKPAKNTQVRSSFAAVTGYSASTSTVRTIAVAPKVTAKLSAASVRLGRASVLTGTVAPNLKTKLVFLQQKIGRSWKDVTKVKLTSVSAYKFTLKPARKGVYLYRLRVPAYAPYVNGFGPQSKLTVK